MSANPSEFGGGEVRKSGFFNVLRPKWALRYIYRTGKDPVPPEAADLDAEPDDWGTGGLRKPTDKIV